MAIWPSPALAKMWAACWKTPAHLIFGLEPPLLPKYPAEMPAGCAPPAERCTPELIVPFVVTVTIDPAADAIAVAWLIARMPCEPEVILEPTVVVTATLPLPNLEPLMP